jgi:hypothetical protein
MISKAPFLVCFWVLLGCGTLARADVIYDFSGGTIFPGTTTFQYRSPTFVAADLSVPASALDSCEVSGEIMGPCFAVNFFPSGPDIPTHNPEITLPNSTWWGCEHSVLLLSIR